MLGRQLHSPVLLVAYDKLLFFSSLLVRSIQGSAMFLWALFDDS